MFSSESYGVVEGGIGRGRGVRSSVYPNGGNQVVLEIPIGVGDVPRRGTNWKMTRKMA